VAADKALGLNGNLIFFKTKPMIMATAAIISWAQLGGWLQLEALV
jgi:hypothetical protein